MKSRWNFRITQTGERDRFFKSENSAKAYLNKVSVDGGDFAFWEIQRGGTWKRR